VTGGKSELPTGLVRSSECRAHDPGPGHPESAERLVAIEERLQAVGLWSALDVAAARPAEREDLLRIHAAHYLQRVEERIARGADWVDSPDANVSLASWRTALLAAGGALEAVDRVQEGRWKNAFVAIRPPGHHAEENLAMGFCLLNNVAIAARHLQAKHGLERIAILDWDVHHGNGTQHLFERDPTVFYASLHEYPHYPGTGSKSERGLGAGEGATLNCPMPPRSGEREWLAALEGEILPALERFRPEFVLVSAGFDAHRRDPLSSTELDESSFAAMSARALELAARYADGRLVSVLEGGYDLDALARSVEAHVAELARAPSDAVRG
jgi:acetoin utilization deacetylase AcuC-like enzyme